jgi:hypothetical protein
MDNDETQAKVDAKRRALLSRVLAVAGTASIPTLSGCGGAKKDASASTIAAAPASDPPSSSPSAPPVAPPAPASAPAPAPPAAQAVGKYRYQQPSLFQTARASSEPSRLPGGDPLSNEGFGPTRTYVDSGMGWGWDNPGGDWLDATQTRMGAQSWWSVVANKASGPTAVASYSADVTSALRFVQSNDRWNAFLMRCLNAPRVLAGVFSATPPRIDVTYVGGATATLNCRLVAVNDASTQISATCAPEITLPAFLEFDKPIAAVQAATLSFTITQHWSGGVPLIEGFVLDPPVNGDPTVQGIAATADLDAGLVGHPAIIGVHRYLDGVPFANFVYPATINTDDESQYDPAIYGTGPTDLTKLPHAGLGKWVATSPGWSKVDSSYSAEGFVPLAPSMGAIRVSMPKAPGITDGSIVGYYGTLAADARLFMPEPLFGNLDHIFVRHYFRLGSPNGRPYRMPMVARAQVYKQAGQAPVWTDCAGKFGIMPSHTTTDGGVSGTSGGGYGWQMRLGWADCTVDDIGPDLGGWNASLHTYDFGSNNPVGYNYGSSDTPAQHCLGQRGGLGGSLYADRWYCIEAEMKLNTVFAGAPGFAPDGELRVWIDGRKTFERTGMVFRSLPLNNPGYRAGYSRPCRQLGVRDLWFNWFHGGLTQNTTDRTVFIAGVAWGTSYIGPMKGTTAT